MELHEFLGNLLPAIDELSRLNKEELETGSLTIEEATGYQFAINHVLKLIGTILNTEKENKQ